MLKQIVYLLLVAVLLTGNILRGQNSGQKKHNCCESNSSCCSDQTEKEYNNIKEKVEIDFAAKHVSRSYRQTINATSKIIFPLLCPVREAEWLDDWDYKMIYSVSGVAEKGAVFTTSYWEDSEQTWIITKHDSIKSEIQFARFVPGFVTSVLDINVLPKDKNSSYVDVTYTYTGLTEKGNNFLEKSFTEEFFAKNMKEWEDSMNYFLKTGTMLKTTH